MINDVDWLVTGSDICRAPNEAKLVHRLLTHYYNLGKVARPRFNSSRTLTVQLGLQLIQLDLIEKEQILKTSVWVRAVSINITSLKTSVWVRAVSIYTTSLKTSV